LLFLIHVNNLDCSILNWILKFADNTKVFSQVSSLEQHLRLQTNLNTLYKWPINWQKDFNVDKYVVLLIRDKAMQYSYIMNGKTLASVNHERDLGTIVSNDLESYNQCHPAYIKASRVLGMIKQMIQSRNPKLLLPLHKSLVHPHLEYCTPCWSSHYNKDKALLEKVQHHFTHLFSDLHSLTDQDPPDHLPLWSLEECHHCADLTEVYRILHGLSPFTAGTFFAVAHDSQTRVHSLKLSRQHCKTDIGLHFFMSESLAVGTDFMRLQSVLHH
jgi:hypothetical protein